MLISTPVEFMWNYGLPFVLILSVLVFVHEWGHYIVARLCGVRVETFSIGFGRELFGRTDKSGTRWKFSLLPLGGYVQMFGDVDPASAQNTVEVEDEQGRKHEMTAEERKEAFFAQPVGKRAVIVFAGPAINFIFAILILAGLYTFQGQPYTPPIAAKILEGSPADQAGMQPDDKIIAINGEKIKSFQDVAQAVAINLDTEMKIQLVRYKGDGEWMDEPITLAITPELIVNEDRFGFRHSRGRLGIQSPSNVQEMQKHSLPGALVASVSETWSLTTGTLKAIGQMITGTRSTDELGGIIRIGAYAGEFAQNGFVSMITFAALLSVNLGLLNLLPIPMLDGGHLAFYAMETIKGKPVSERFQEYALRLGFVFLLGIMVFATWNDLVQMKVIDYFVALVS